MPVPDIGSKPKFPLVVEVWDGGHGADMKCSLTYDAGTLAKSRVANILRHFEMITAAVVGESDLIIGENSINGGQFPCYIIIMSLTFHHSVVYYV